MFAFDFEAFFEWLVAVPVRGALVVFLAIGLAAWRVGLGSLRFTATFLVFNPVPETAEEAAEVKFALLPELFVTGFFNR